MTTVYETLNRWPTTGKVGRKETEIAERKARMLPDTTETLRERISAYTMVEDRTYGKQ